MTTKDVVLIVEDKREWRETLGAMLSETGYECVQVASFADGLASLSRREPKALLLDLRLGAGEESEFLGWKLAEYALDQRIPTIIVTAYGSIESVNKAFRQYKVIAFLDKGSLDSEKLIEAVSEAIHSARQSRLSEEETANLIRELRHFFVHVQEDLQNTENMGAMVKKQEFKFILHYNRLRGLLNVTVQDDLGNFLFGADSPLAQEIDIEAFGVRADEAWRSPKWRTLIRGIGRDLYSILFDDHPKVVEAYTRTIGMVDNQESALNLIFYSTRDTLRLPVEFLHDGQDYLCLRHPMSRRLQELHSRPPLSLALPSDRLFPILLVSSNTGGIPGVDEEISVLRRSLPKLQVPNGVELEITVLPTSRASISKVTRELEDRNYYLWHYAGHGSYDEDSPERSSLFFWEKGRAKGEICRLMASDLQDIAKNSSLTMVYLSCCLGSTSGNKEQLYDDDFLGIADALVQARVSTVIGFRWPVSDRGAIDLARAFYRSFCEELNPRQALWLARRAITRGPQKRDDPTWASPILIQQN